MFAKTRLPAVLVALLYSQLVTLIRAQSTNSTTNLPASNSTTGTLATHHGTDIMGITHTCVGPTAPPGLSFPIQTVVELLTSVSGPTTGMYYFADDYGAGTKIPFTATGATAVYTTFTRELKPQFDPHEYPIKCCGQCTVYFSMVDVMYWPVPGANTACLNGDSISGMNTALATIPPSNNSISTTIGPDGFTYISPSIYVAYHDISASNSCGQVGSKHTSVTLSFQPGQLSTINYSPGLFGFGGNPGEPKPFDLKNLPCPPQSLIDAQESANQPGLSLPARGTYAPIIAPPAIQSLDPAWKTCISFYAFDPPKTLAPATAMVPSPTPANQAEAQATSAMPSPMVDGPPVQTPTASASIIVDPPSRSTDPKGAVDPTTAADPNSHSVDNVPFVSGTQDPLPKEGESKKFSEPLASASVYISPTDNPQLQADESPHSAPPQPIGPVVAIGGHTLTVLPSGGFAIADSTLHANDPAITILGTLVSVGSSELVAGSSTVKIPSGKPNGAFTAAGHAFTTQPGSGVIVAGNTLSVSGPAATVSGTVVSLASSGLIIGTQTFAIPTPGPDPTTSSTNGPATTISGIALSLAPSGVVIGDQTFALPPAAPGRVGDTVVIDGTTLTAGNPVITIAGMPVSLVTGTAGLYVAGLGPGSTAFSAPVIAGESISVNPAGQIAVDGTTVSGSAAGSMGLGSAIMLGFGAASTAAIASSMGGYAGATQGNGSAATGVLGFTGEGRERVDLPMLATLLPMIALLGWHAWYYIAL